MRWKSSRALSRARARVELYRRQERSRWDQKNSVVCLISRARVWNGTAGMLAARFATNG